MSSVELWSVQCRLSMSGIQLHKVPSRHWNVDSASAAQHELQSATIVLRATMYWRGKSHSSSDLRTSRKVQRKHFRFLRTGWTAVITIKFIFCTILPVPDVDQHFQTWGWDWSDSRHRDCGHRSACTLNSDLARLSCTASYQIALLPHNRVLLPRCHSDMQPLKCTPQFYK